MRLILGSKSQARRAVMDQLQLQYDVVVADIDERAIGNQIRGGRVIESVARQVAPVTIQIATAKADAICRLMGHSGDGGGSGGGDVAAISTESLLITCDEVVVCNGLVREKPRSAEECREFLRSYSQYPATCCSALVITHLPSMRRLQVLSPPIYAVFDLAASV